MKSLSLLFLFALMGSLFGAPPTADTLLQQQTQQMLQNASLAGEKSDAFGKTLLASTEWQRELLDSGQVEKPAAVMSLLFALWRADPAMASNPIDRAMATACALEGPRRDWGVEEMQPRYEYFRDKWKLGLLNKVYAELNVFQRRYLARGVQHQHLNQMSSMEYQNMEVCLPAEKYTGACWYARWILHNPFGDSIHGPKYYKPYRDSWGSAAEMIRKIGGVCGSLSNFGAAAAIANGVPAATMGEPGHCAYSVMVKPSEWRPAYSLSWKRGLHTSYYSGSWGWHIFNNKAHASQQVASDSADLRRLAAYYASQKQLDKAIASLYQAQKVNRYDWQVWLQTAELLKSHKAPRSQWINLHKQTLSLLAPECGEIGWHYLNKYIYPELLSAAPDQLNLRRSSLLAFQKAINGWGIARWDYARCLGEQIKFLKAPTAEQDQFIVAAFGIHAKQNLFTPIIFEEQLKIVAKDDKRRQRFIASIGRALSRGSKEDFGKVIDTMAAKVLPDAAKRGDKATFQFIGKLTAKNYPATSISPPPFPGILLSSGGTLQIDQPANRWDKPERHWGVIEPHGGGFHTGSKEPFVMVQLGNYGRLSGVIIVTRGGHVGRLNGAILQTSTNGKDWTDVHTFSKVSRTNRIDLLDKKIDAGYIRVTHPDGQPLHFEKFHTYGKKQN